MAVTEFVVDRLLCKNKSDIQRMLKENYLSEKDLPEVPIFDEAIERDATR